jgi:hypothetical protein
LEMPNSVYDRGILKPADIAKLRKIFDEACALIEIEPDSGDAREIALTILALHNAGMVEEETLRNAVCYRRPVSRSA